MQSRKDFNQRRRRLLKGMNPNSVALVVSAPVTFRNSDVEHDYRQNSDFYYLTGLAEPESVLLLSNQSKRENVVLFVRPRDPEKERWEGPRVGFEWIKRELGVDSAYSIKELSEKLPEFFTNIDCIYYRYGIDCRFDELVFQAINIVRKRKRDGIVAPNHIIDCGLLLHELRIKKSKEEIKAMVEAANITRDAFLRAMEIARPGLYEYQVEAEMSRIFRYCGGDRKAFGSIIASGPNSTYLHYRNNDRLMQEGDLLLIDAGVEYGYYACDVSRTFPISGRFTTEQRLLYEVVLEAQESAISKIRPGVTLNEIHREAVKVIVKGLIELGLIGGPFSKAIKEKTYMQYYMHRTSHWLGMDVHDVGEYYINRKPRLLTEGFAFTVEPGIYISETAKVAKKWRGIGIRIEDDIVVTSDGCINLTAGIPKTVAELEKVLISRQQNVLSS